MDFAHSQGQKIGIQLAHAGRKASAVAPWISGSDASSAKVGGWPDSVVAPSAMSYSDRMCDPKALSVEGIEALKGEWGKAVKRAVEAGFDAVEIHNAHGYLLHEFCSPASNHRMDQYGGSFENRTRLTMEIVDVCRREMPESMPLFIRISASDLLEEVEESSWRIEDSIELAKRLVGKGVDVIDVSCAGVSPKQKMRTEGPSRLSVGGRANAYQAVSLAGSLVSSVLALVVSPCFRSKLMSFCSPGRIRSRTQSEIKCWSVPLGV